MKLFKVTITTNDGEKHEFIIRAKNMHQAAAIAANDDAFRGRAIILNESQEYA